LDHPGREGEVRLPNRFGDPSPTSKGRTLTQANQAPSRPAPPLPAQVWVTPKVATEWLELNLNNRKLRESRAEGFARDMLNGVWDESVVNGIHFVTEDGLLGDGQHRLRAVELAGASSDAFTGLWFFVQRIPRTAVAKAVDRGSKRTVTDSLHFEGLATNAVQAAIARKVLMLRAGFPPGGGGHYRPTDAEIHDLLTGPNGELVNEADRVSSLIRREGRLAARASVIGIAYYQAALINREKAQEFFVRQLAHSEGLVKESPANALRRRLGNASTAKATMNDTEQYNYIVYAWNHYREGNHLERLSAPRSWGPNGYAVAV
jgi:hypothetical protein